MRIDHIAIWTKDLEKMKDFYEKFFKMKSNKKYHNPKKKNSSYFLTFDNGARIELMHRPDIVDLNHNYNQNFGLAHFAISVGSIKMVDELTEIIRKNGFKIIGEPRITGDGYYESIIADPEGNYVEITE